MDASTPAAATTARRMTPPVMRLAALALVAALALDPALAGDKHDHDKARAALERGEIKPLEEILTLVRDRLEGRIVGVEIERQKGHWMYEFRLVDDKGRISEVYVDGLSGRIEKVEKK